jgi:hypothetical protein
MTGELFARATMLLEDMHMLAMEGQRRDMALERRRALLAGLWDGMAALETVLRDLAVQLGAAGGGRG